MRKIAIGTLKAMTLLMDGACIVSFMLVLGIADFKASALPLIAAMVIIPPIWALIREYLGSRGWTVGLSYTDYDYEDVDIDDEDEFEAEDDILSPGYRKVV